MTDQDLTAAPELSVFGPAAYPETSETQPEQKPKDRTKEFDSFQRELYSLLKQKKKADASCARARQQMIYHQLKPSKEVRFITPFEEPAACIEARELQERIKKQELLLIELQV